MQRIVSSYLNSGGRIPASEIYSWNKLLLSHLPESALIVTVVLKTTEQNFLELPLVGVQRFIHE